MKKIILTTAIALACIISFKGLFGAATGPGKMDELIRRYQAAQALQGPSSSSESSSSSSTTLFDDAGARKRTTRNENENEDQGEAPKHQRIIEDPAELAEESDRMHQKYYLEELKHALVHKNGAAAYNAIRQFFLYSSNKKQDAQLVSALPELRTFSTENLLAGNYNSIRPIYDLLPIDLQNDVIFKRTDKNRDEFISDMNQKLNEGDFSTVNDFGWLLPRDLQAHFSIKMKGKDSQEIVYLAPYTATQYSNTLKHMFSPELIQATGYNHAPLSFANLTDHALRKMAQLFSKAKTTQRMDSKAIDNFVAQLINSGFFVDETPETFKDLFEAANTLDAAPLIKGILTLGVLATIRQRYNSDFNLLDNLDEDDKKIIAKTSFLSRPHQIAGQSLQAFQNEDTWRIKYYALSVAEVAPYIHAHSDNELNLQRLNIESLEGLSSIPNIAEIQELDLTFNRLFTLSTEAFIGFNNLEKLYLGHNFLQTIQPDTFSATPNLSEIYLFNNNLQTIHPDIFRGLNQLRYIDLSSNPLQEIDLAMFDHLPQLSVIVISKTPLANNADFIKRIRAKVEQVTGRRPQIIT